VARDLHDKGMPNTTHDGPPIADQPQQPDLESRIKVRRAELIKVLTELKGDTHLGSSEARDKLRARLSELAHLIKSGVVDGWTTIGEPVLKKLQQWLAESAHQVPAAPATSVAPTSPPPPVTTPAPAGPPVPAKAGQS